MPLHQRRLAESGKVGGAWRSFGPWREPQHAGNSTRGLGRLLPRCPPHTGITFGTPGEIPHHNRNVTIAPRPPIGDRNPHLAGQAAHQRPASAHAIPSRQPVSLPGRRYGGRPSHTGMGAHRVPASPPIPYRHPEDAIWLGRPSHTGFVPIPYRHRRCSGRLPPLRDRHPPRSTTTATHRASPDGATPKRTPGATSRWATRSGRTRPRRTVTTPAYGGRVASGRAERAEGRSL